MDTPCCGLTPPPGSAKATLTQTPIGSGVRNKEFQPGNSRRQAADEVIVVEDIEDLDLD